MAKKENKQLKSAIAKLESAEKRINHISNMVTVSKVEYLELREMLAAYIREARNK